MVQNSVGNIVEILNLLDKDVYTEAQLQENYKMLIDKWGEWEIIGAGSAGLVVRYVDVGNALFSGLMMTYSIVATVCLVLSILLGKLVFPMMAKMYTDSNDEMVDLATIRSADKVNKLAEKKKEWF